MRGVVKLSLEGEKSRRGLTNLKDNCTRNFVSIPPPILLLLVYVKDKVNG